MATVKSHSNEPFSSSSQATAPKPINKPPIQIDLAHTPLCDSPVEKRSVCFLVPDEHDDSQDSLVVGDEDEFYVLSPTDSIDISVQDLKPGMLVALVNRDEEMRDLVFCNQDFFDTVKQSIFSSEYDWNSFLDILFASRARILDSDWMTRISKVLSSNPPLLVKFKEIVGYYGDEDDQKNRPDEDNPHYDHIPYDFNAKDRYYWQITLIRDYPTIVNNLEKSYPQFFKNAQEILSQETQRRGSPLGGNHLTDVIPLQNGHPDCDYSIQAKSTIGTLYDEFKNILTSPRCEINDDEWEISIYECLDPWKQLVAQFEEIIIYEIGDELRSNQL